MLQIGNFVHNSIILVWYQKLYYSSLYLSKISKSDNLPFIITDDLAEPF